MPFISAGIVAGGGLLSGILDSNAAQNAARTQALASQNAVSAELGVARVIQGQLAPYLGAGTNALRYLAPNLALGGQLDPFYAFYKAGGMAFNCVSSDLIRQS
jgi:hypothetical protein